MIKVGDQDENKPIWNGFYNTWRPGPWWGALQQYLNNRYQHDIDEELAKRDSEITKKWESVAETQNKRFAESKRDAQEWASKYKK